MAQRDTAAWQTGTHLGLATYSKLHIWKDGTNRMLCGVAPNWRIGNFGDNNAGRCARCFAIAARDGIEVQA